MKKKDVVEENAPQLFYVSFNLLELTHIQRASMLTNMGLHCIYLCLDYSTSSSLILNWQHLEISLSSNSHYYFVVLVI